MKKIEKGYMKVLVGFLAGVLALAGCGAFLFIGEEYFGLRFGLTSSLNFGRTGCGKSEGLVAATSLASAVENFHGEYNRLPDVGARRIETNSAEGVELLAILLGLEGVGPQIENTRGITFLQLKKAKRKKGGIAFDAHDNAVGLYDSYGNPYTVILNEDEQDSLNFSYGGQQVKLRGRQAAVWSVGRDCKEGTKDDIKTWN